MSLPKWLPTANVLLALVLGWQPARAEDAISVELVDKAVKGQGLPQLVVRVRAPLAGLSLELERADGKQVRQKAGRVGAGTTRTFDLEQPEGSFRYTGRVRALFPRGAPQELPVDFEAHLYGPPKLILKDDAVDLAAHKVTFSIDRAPATAHVRVFADDAAELADFDADLSTAHALEPITLGWQQNDAAIVLRVALRVTDRNGYYQDVDLYPWQVEIPHEDVLFGSGQSEIVDDQRPKLDAALTELATMVQRYGKVANVQLFIAGFTDTVGDAAANQQLSAARALAIARYFRARGLRIGIHHAGLGETGLLVPTPEETPEARNRRATYKIAVVPPPGVKWSKLP